MTQSCQMPNPSQPVTGPRWLHGVALCAAVLAALPALVACGSPHGVHVEEGFEAESPYFRRVSHGPVQACDAVQEALLSQGYRIEPQSDVHLRARKDFQPDEEHNVTIDFEVHCKRNPSTTTIYANAVETTYALKKSGGAGSLNVPGAGTLAMSWGKSTDALVKVAGKTIEDVRFYQRFFDLLDKFLPP